MRVDLPPSARSTGSSASISPRSATALSTSLSGTLAGLGVLDLPRSARASLPGVAAAAILRSPSRASRPSSAFAQRPTAAAAPPLGFTSATTNTGAIRRNPLSLGHPRSSVSPETAGVMVCRLCPLIALP